MVKIKHLSQNGLHEKSIEKAKKYLADENYVDAKDEIEKVLDVNPADDRALNLLAIIMLKLEQFNRAVKIYEELIIRYPQTIPLRTNLGVAYLKNNQPDNALEEFSVVLQKEPENKTILKLYGKALLRLNRTDEAIEIFKKIGMDAYVKKIQKSGSNEAVESELSTDDIMQEAIAKDKTLETQERISVQENIVEQNAKAQQSDSIIAENTQQNDTEQQHTEQSSAEDRNEEQIIETERGPSAIDEQGLMNMQAAEENIKEETVKSEELRVKPVSMQAQSVSKGTETQKEGIEAAVPHDVKQEQENMVAKPAEGLPFIAEVSSIAKFDAAVNFINDSMLLFNLSGNIVYVRDKGIISLTENLTIEPAYKRYRGKDTKSIFAEKKDDPIVLVYGKGGLLLKSNYKSIKEFNLKNESMFLDDERLIAFHGDLEWENGRVEIQTDKNINVTQIRGTANVFVGLQHNLHSIDVNTEHYISVRLNSLIGWYGKLIPRQSSVTHYSSNGFISFHGEGVVFIDA
jgi:Tfp pilus assembly protein PilF/uncharacterized protein (AIM24 family)